MKTPNFIRSGRLIFVYAPFVSSGDIAQNLAATQLRWCDLAIIVLLHRQEQAA
jgi:hypothetical protein